VTIFSDFFEDFRSGFQKKSELTLYIFIERFDFFGGGGSVSENRAGPV